MEKRTPPTERTAGNRILTATATRRGGRRRPDPAHPPAPSTPAEPPSPSPSPSPPHDTAPVAKWARVAVLETLNRRIIDGVERYERESA